jgi:hypothetical protein
MFRHTRLPKEERVKQRQHLKEEYTMNVIQDKDDEALMEHQSQLVANSNSLKSKLNKAKQMEPLFSALLSRPGANASDKQMDEAVVQIVDLHKQVSMKISDELVGDNANSVQLAMVGRSSAGLSASAWEHNMSADDAAELFIKLSKASHLTPNKNTDSFISDDKLSSVLNIGSSSAKYLPILTKLNAIPAGTQRLYIGDNTAFDLTKELTRSALYLSDTIYDSIMESLSGDVSEKDKVISKSSINTTVSTMLASAVISEMNIMTKEFKAMSNDERRDYLDELENNPERIVLADRAINIVSLFKDELYHLQPANKEEYLAPSAAPN